MTAITLEEAQAHLAEVIDRLKPDEEIVITKNEKFIARLTAVADVPKPPRKLGTLKGTILYIAPDFDAPMEEFKEYME